MSNALLQIDILQLYIFVTLSSKYKLLSLSPYFHVMLPENVTISFGM